MVAPQLYYVDDVEVSRKDTNTAAAVALRLSKLNILTVAFRGLGSNQFAGVKET